MQIKEARCKKRLTQNEIAYRCGIPQPTLSQIENGFLQPSLAVLERIGEALGVPGDQLEVPEEPKTRWDL
jgi:transcriptional regulator with XRE-family HTH domain